MSNLRRPYLSGGRPVRSRFGSKFRRGYLGNPVGPALLVGSDTSPFITAYQFLGGSVANGFAGVYKTPSVLPTGIVNGIAFSPNRQYVAFSLLTPPYISVYPWNDISGFGTKVNDPVILPDNAALYVSWSPDGNYVGVSTNNGTFEAIYPFSNGSFGSRISAPGTALPGLCNAIAWSPDGAYVGFASSITPFVQVYNWSAGYGSKVTNPVSIPSTNCLGIGWNPSGTVISVCSSSVLYGYPWSAGYGTRFNTNTSAITQKLAWSPDGNFVGISGTALGGKISIVPYSNGIFLPATTVTINQGSSSRFAWKPTNDFIAVTGHATAPVSVVHWSPASGTLGNTLPNPSILAPVTSTAAGVAWSK